VLSSDVIAQTAPRVSIISVWQSLAALIVGARHIFANDECGTRISWRMSWGARASPLAVVPTLLRAIIDQMPDESISCALTRLRRLTLHR